MGRISDVVYIPSIVKIGSGVSGQRVVEICRFQLNCRLAYNSWYYRPTRRDCAAIELCMLKADQGLNFTDDNHLCGSVSICNKRRILS